MSIQLHPQSATGTAAASLSRRLRNAALVATVAVFGLSACAGLSDTQRRTATGAGIGGAVGGVIGGSQSGGKGVRNGALIGGALGALGTYIWSSRMEEQKRAMEESTQGTGVEVVRTNENLLMLDIPSRVVVNLGETLKLPLKVGDPKLSDVKYALDDAPILDHDVTVGEDFSCFHVKDLGIRQDHDLSPMLA